MPERPGGDLKTRPCGAPGEPLFNGTGFHFLQTLGAPASARVDIDIAEQLYFGARNDSLNKQRFR